ncbi:hypothetical protein [Burkholderia cenocepacia]|uniref:hypothetical protein n=1 Tax=Burkholderia cenocepacia TaxID=95486 RepID=UPI002AB27EF1|nr:hypothetical protein [Burkholderia cenocepacia]
MHPIEDEIKTLCNRMAVIVGKSMSLSDNDKVDESFFELERDAKKLVDKINKNVEDLIDRARLVKKVDDDLKDVAFLFENVFLKNNLKNNLSLKCSRGENYKECVSYRVLKDYQRCQGCNVEKRPFKI